MLNAFSDTGPGLVTVAFEVYAPSIEKIELVGAFSDWRPPGVALKGPDAVGYRECRRALPPGRCEYLFLVNGDRLVMGRDGGFYRPDGFGRRNNVLLLRKETPRRFVQAHISAARGEVLVPKKLPVRGAIFPRKQGDRWRAILHRGASAGFQEFPLEEALAGLAAAEVEPHEADEILDPLFQEVTADMQARYVLLKRQEGILKGASLEEIASAIQKRNQWFNKARDLLVQTGCGEGLAESPALLASTALAFESGLQPLFLREILSAGRDRSLNRIKVVMEAGESLYHAGFAQRELQLIMKDCLLKDLECAEIERVARHVSGKLREGLGSERILDDLWRKPGSAST